MYIGTECSTVVFAAHKTILLKFWKYDLNAFTCVYFVKTVKNQQNKVIKKFLLQIKTQVEMKIGKTEVFNDFEFREYKVFSKDQTSETTSIQLLVRKK